MDGIGIEFLVFSIKCSIHLYDVCWRRAALSQETYRPYQPPTGVCGGSVGTWIKNMWAFKGIANFMFVHFKTLNNALDKNI